MKKSEPIRIDDIFDFDDSVDFSPEYELSVEELFHRVEVTYSI